MKIFYARFVRTTSHYGVVLVFLFCYKITRKFIGHYFWTTFPIRTTSLAPPVVAVQLVLLFLLPSCDLG